jgi:hypothetical protein
LPSYAPEHNPDEFLNNDLKQAMARHRTPRDKVALKSSLTSYMRSLQRCPDKDNNITYFLFRLVNSYGRCSAFGQLCQSRFLSSGQSELV